jgi:hypothetical protein
MRSLSSSLSMRSVLTGLRHQNGRSSPLASWTGWSLGSMLMRQRSLPSMMKNSSRRARPLTGGQVAFARQSAMPVPIHPNRLDDQPMVLLVQDGPALTFDSVEELGQRLGRFSRHILRPRAVHDFIMLSNTSLRDGFSAVPYASARRPSHSSLPFMPTSLGG